MSGVRSIRLFGGLGNQLFQFAMMRGLQTDGGPVVVEDASTVPEILRCAVQDDQCRTLTAREAWQLRRAPLIGPRPRVQTLLDIQKSSLVRKFLDGRTHRDSWWGDFDPTIADLDGPVLFVGYFQREEYFLHVADQVAGALKPIPSEARVLVDEARSAAGSVPLVAIHLRAGTSYVELGWNPHYSWFRRAAESVIGLLGEAGFVIVSDIPLAAEAVAEGLKDLGPVFAVPQIPDYDALSVLRLADHMILSPSTFSWWGAWLGDFDAGFTASRLVIAPQPWIYPGTQISPARWTLLE